MCENSESNNVNVTEVENELRDVESKLESVGRKICSAPNGGESWSAINRAIDEVRSAIHSAYKMRV